MEVSFRSRFRNPGPLANGPVSAKNASVCGQCVYLNDRTNNKHNPRRLPGCLMYLKLTGSHGDSVPRNAPSCKYFSRGE